MFLLLVLFDIQRIFLRQDLEEFSLLKHLILNSSFPFDWSLMTPEHIVPDTREALRISKENMLISQNQFCSGISWTTN